MKESQIMGRAAAQNEFFELYKKAKPEIIFEELKENQITL